MVSLVPALFAVASGLLPIWVGVERPRLEVDGSSSSSKICWINLPDFDYVQTSWQR